MNWLCDGHRQYSTARGGLTTATLAVSNGAKSIRIHAGTAAALLFTAHFRGHQPAVAVADGTVSLRFGAEPSAGDGRVALHPDVTWNIRVRNGANELQADLTNIRLASIDIEGTFSRLALHLPPLRDQVPVHLRGRADEFHITRPVGDRSR